MEENKSRISQAELEIMKILWKTEEPVPTGDIVRKLSEQMGWDRSTVRTLLKRLTEKGAVVTKKINVLCYLPVISEKEYCDFQTKNLVERLYGGSAKRLVSSLVENYNLTSSDMEELRKLLHPEGDKND